MTALPARSTSSEAGGSLGKPRTRWFGALVGRQQELADLVAAVLAPPSLVVIEGEAGIGKTRLVRELQQHPSLSGRRLVIGACRAIQEPFPLGPVLEAMHQLRDAWPASLSPVVGALRPFLPELTDVLPAPPALSRSVDTQRHQVFRAVREVWEAVGPVTVVLEDLHWADEFTTDLLRYLVGDLPVGLSLVLTMRAEEADPAVRALTSRVAPPARRAHLILQPLDEAQTGELVDSLLATGRVSPEAAAYLRERTGGLPFAIEEVAAVLRQRGVSAAPGQAWSRRELEQLAVPVAVRDHVLQRASLLPAPARMLVDIVAVLQAPASEELIAQVAGAPLEEIAADLVQTLTSGLLVDDGTAIGFRHVLAAQAVYDGLPGPRRRELHHRVASALQATGVEATGQLAFHLRNAGRLAEWAGVAERAAATASELGHVDEAARLLEDVLRHAPLEADDEVRLAVALGRVARSTLRAGDIADVLANALQHEAPRATRGELQWLLGAVLDDANVDGARARELFAQAFVNAEGRPDIQAQAAIVLEMRNLPEVGYAERHHWLTEVRALVDQVDDADLRVYLLGKVGLVQVSLGDPRWRDTLAQVDTLSAQEPVPRGSIAAYESISQAACFAGHVQVAESLLDRVRAADYLHRDEKLDALVQGAVLLVDFCRGRWHGLVDRLSVLPERLPFHHRAGYKLRLIAGQLALAHGEFDRAEAHFAELYARIGHADASDLVPMLVAAQIRLLLARGDDAGALAAAQQFVERQESEVLWPAVYRCVPWLAEALSRTGHAAQARQLCTRYAQGMGDRDAPLSHAALAHADGFVHAARGDAIISVRAFVAAATAYDALGCPYEAALARESAAGLLGDPAVDAATSQVAAQAAAQLREAILTYQRLGAGHDQARAVRTARRYGIPVPAAGRDNDPGAGQRLTPRERQVAELAATGLTNKEIATRLVLSAGTVKKHLQSAMKKLGVSSRAAVGRHLPPL